LGLAGARAYVRVLPAAESLEPVSRAKRFMRNAAQTLDGHDGCGCSAGGGGGGQALVRMRSRAHAPDDKAVAEEAL
jgi:hypothetical protein